jgi:hypothetical protein
MLRNSEGNTKHSLHAIYFGFQLLATKYAKHHQCDENVKDNIILSDQSHAKVIYEQINSTRRKRVRIINNMVTNYNEQSQSI